MFQRRLLLLVLSVSLLLAPSSIRAQEPGEDWSLPVLRSIDQPLAPSTGGTFGLPAEWVGPTKTATNTFVLQNPYPRLRDLRPDSDMPSANGLLASTPLLNGRFVAESEFARNTEGGDNTIHRNRSSKGMMRFTLANGDGPFRYGAVYRLAGKEFVNVPDQRLREVWGEWGIGSLRLRSSIGDLLTNVEGDPSRPRLAQTTGRLTMTVARPSWPEFALSYARHLVDTHGLQSGLASQRGIADMLEGAMSVARPTWHARVSSSYILNANRLQAGEETVSYAQMLSGVFHPIEPLSITSVISYRTDIQQWTGVRTDTPVASLALHYRHSAALMLSALGGYTGVRSSDGLTDNESVNSKGIVTWSPWGSSVTQVSFETGYTRTVLGGSGGGGMVTEDLSGLVRVRLTEF